MNTLLRSNSIRASKIAFPLSVLMLGIVGVRPVAVIGQHVTTSVIKTEADPEFQSALDRVAGSRDDTERRAAIYRLLRLDDHDMRLLIPQVMFYAANHENDPAGKAAVGRVFERIESARQTIVTALAPLLDDADPAIQRMTRDILRGFEDRSANRPPDYSAYYAVLEADFRGGRPTQASLVKFMVDGDAGVALLTIMRASQLRDPAEIKPILWAEHVVADLLWRRQFGFVEAGAVEPAVVREIDKMSQHTAWWARLYAAEIIRKHPELGTKATRDRLAVDANELVRKSAAVAAQPSK